MNMLIKRLSGPNTHICWTPDAVPQSQRQVVVLVKESDLIELEIKLNRAKDLLSGIVSNEDDYFPLEEIEDFLEKD